MKNPPTDRDTLFAGKQQDLINFEFNEQVAQVFPDMITRSVPGYRNLITQIGLLAEQYARPDSHCYDLGCSLGAATLSMQQRIQADNCDIIAVDNSAAMLKRCQLHLAAADESSVAVQLQCADIRDVTIENASIVVLNFTLQFITLEQREPLLQNIYHGLLPGGVLILSEKLCFTEDTEQQLMTDLHLAFKRANGYSDLEISQKRAALENVLIPETLTTHIERLKRVGFSQASQWFQCFNFASILAIK